MSCVRAAWAVSGFRCTCSTTTRGLCVGMRVNAPPPSCWDQVRHAGKLLPSCSQLAALHFTTCRCRHERCFLARLTIPHPCTQRPYTCLWPGNLACALRTAQAHGCMWCIDAMCLGPGIFLRACQCTQGAHAGTCVATVRAPDGAARPMYALSAKLGALLGLHFLSAGGECVCRYTASCCSVLCMQSPQHVKASHA